MPLAFQDVPKPFVGGLDESVEPKLLEDGYTVVENGWYDKDGRISKRPGLTTFAVDAPPTTARRLLVYDNKQLLGTDDKGRLVAVRDADDEFVLQDLGSEATVASVGIRRETDRSMVYIDMAIAGAYTVYAWINDVGPAVYYRIIETVTGTVVAFGSLATAATTTTSLRLATNGSHVLLTFADGPNNDLYARRIDCSTNPPTVGTETALVTNINTSPNYDICAMLTGWAVAYRSSTPGRIVREVVNANPPTLGWNDTSATDSNNLSCAEVGVRLFIVYSVVGPNDVTYRVLTSSTGALFNSFALEAGATAPGPSGVVAVTSTAALMTWKSNLELIKWRAGSETAVDANTHQNFRVRAESKPWYVSSVDEVYQWVTTENVFVLVCLDRIGNSTANMRPVATAGFDVASFAGERQELGNIGTFSATDRRVAVRRQTIAGSALIGADEFRANFSDRRNHQGVTYGRALYVSGGILAQWDGVQLVENSFIQKPRHTVAANNAAGTLLAGSYQTVVVFEEFDDNGELTRSIPSDIVTTALTGGASRLEVTALYPLTLTMRQDDAQTIPRVEIAIYVTEANLDIFYRTVAIGSGQANDFNRTTPYGTIIIDAPIPTANATLYTTGGVLENDAVYGGGTILVEHKGRLWVAGGEDDELIWYSQPRVDGEPALFSIAQQIRVSGHIVTSLASLDDALIVFTRSGIFAIYGDGPNALGDPNSGAFTDPVPLASDTGALGAASGENHATVVSPGGILFPTLRGIYLLDRSRSVRFIGEPVVDTTDTFFVVRKATLVPTYGHVRFIVGPASDDENGRVLVWDYTEDKWSVWSYFSGAALADSAFNIVYHVWRRSNRTVYVEGLPLAPTFTDAGAWYGVTIETGWMSFAVPFAFKRLRRIGVSINRDGTGGLTVELARNGGAYVTRTFTEAEITALTQDMVRVHVGEQKGNRYRVRLKETQPAVAGQGLEFVGLLFNVGQKGREQRLEAGASK